SGATVHHQRNPHETLRWCRLTFRSSRSIKAENLFLRRQLALYVERGVKPQRIDPLTRIALTLLSRLFSWQCAVVMVARYRHQSRRCTFGLPRLAAYWSHTQPGS